MSAISVINFETPIRIILTILVAYILYYLVSRLLKSAVLQHGTLADYEMMRGFWRIIMTIITPMFIVAIFLPDLWFIPTLFSAFGGLFLGWALQPIVTSVAVWVLISIKRPFKLGDRIQIPTLGLKGDVLEVGVMYTILDQVGGSVESEEAVGREILIPNSVLFNNPAINFTPGTPTQETISKYTRPTYTLDEAVVRITFDTDWFEAERIMLGAAKEITNDIIEVTGKEPYIRSDMYDYGVLLRLRYMTLSTDRPRIKYALEKRIFNEFQKNPRVDFAIPYVYSAKTHTSREDSERGNEKIA